MYVFWCRILTKMLPLKSMKAPPSRPTTSNPHHQVASAASRSMVVDILFIVAPTVCGSFLVFVCVIINAPFYFGNRVVEDGNHIIENKREGCFTLKIRVIMLSCGYLFSVSLPRGGLGGFVIYDCGNSWSYQVICLLQTVKTRMKYPM